MTLPVSPHTHTHAHTHNRLMALCPGLPGWAGTRRNIHSHLSWSSDILYQLPPSTTIPYFFTQSLSSFRNTCPYHHNQFCCSSEIMSSIPNLYLITVHIHLTIFISAHSSFLTGQVSLPWNILLRTQLLYNLPLINNQWYILIGKHWSHTKH